MPKGSKKRKAAKKKKESETTNYASYSHGDDDLKAHEEKESDEGDTGSPTSQDHHNQQHEEEEEEEMEKREDISSVPSVVAQNEPLVGLNGNGENTQQMEMEGNSVIQIDWELDPEDDSDRNNGGVEYIESMNESHGGHKSQDSGTSSSSSSSDDESHVVEKNIVVIESGASQEDAPSLVEERTGCADPVKATDLPPVTQVSDAYNLAVEEAYDPVASKEDANYLVGETATSADPLKTIDLPEVAQVPDGIPVTDAYNLPVEEPKEEAYDLFTKNAFPVNLVDTADLPEVTQVADSLPGSEADSLVVAEPSKLVEETVLPVNSENLSTDVVHVNDSTPISTDFVFGLKENRNDDGSGVSPVVMDNGSQLVNDSAAMDNTMCSSDFGFGLKENRENESSRVSSVVIDTGSHPKEEPFNSLVETIPSVNSKNISEEVGHANDSMPVENRKCSLDLESGMKEIGDHESFGVSPVVRDTGSRPVNDNTSLENPMCRSVFEFGLKENRNTESSGFPPLVMDTSSKLVNDSSPMENPTFSSEFEFEVMENGKIGSSGVSPAVMDIESRPKEDKVSPTTVEYIAVSSVARGSVAKEDEERLTLPSGVPPLENSNGAENGKDKVVTECSDSQPLVAAPRPVQKTFWNSCCGLFELFTGSNG